MRRLVILTIVGFVAGCADNSEPAEKPDSVPNMATVVFTNVTQGSGLGEFQHVTGAVGNKWFPETMGAGGGFLDYDSDGDPDILLVQGDEWSGEKHPAVRLFRNDGTGVFDEQTEAAGLSGTHAYGMGVTAADYDNDGDDDFMLTALGGNRLFRNDSGRFTDVTTAVGIVGPSSWSSAAVFFDADNDGWLDLYIGNYVAWSEDSDIFCSVVENVKSYCTPELYAGQPAVFYQNNGDGTFSESTVKAGLDDSPGKSLAATVLDFNDDGAQDLIVANDTQRDLLYENNGDGTFEEKGVVSGIAFDANGRARAGMGIDIGDLANDGGLSIAVGHFSKEMIGVYEHMGRGLFVDKAAVSQIGRPSLLSLTFGLFLFDVDLDGDLDLLANNGHINQEIEQLEDGITYRQRPQLFINDGSGRFSVPPADGVFDVPIVGRAASYADIDSDGDLDVLLTENGGPAHLWRNETVGGGSIRVRLTGDPSNRNAIGSRITLFADDLIMRRFIHSGAGFLSQSEWTQTFGIGNRSGADSLVVDWTSGKKTTRYNIRAGEVLEIDEGKQIQNSAD